MKKLVVALAVLGAASVSVIVIATSDSESPEGADAAVDSKTLGGRPSEDVAVDADGDVASTQPTSPPRDVVISTEPQGGRPEPSGGYVDPSAVGDTVGARDPTDVLSGDIDFVTDHEILEGVTINGCVTINADDVTLRDVVVNCDDTYPVKDNARTGTRLEHVTIDCMGESQKGVFFENSHDFGVDRVEVRNCDDQFFIDGGLGDSWITNSVLHDQSEDLEAHTDGMQIGEFSPTTGVLVVDGNWWEYDRDGCCDNAVLFLSTSAALTVELRDNFLDDDFGTHLVRCRPESICVVENNIFGGPPDGFVIFADGDAGIARCNRFANGRLVGRSLYTGVTVDNRGC